MTRHQIDPRQCSDSDLARHLLTTRGVHWMHGERGAALPLLLRGLDVDRRALHDEIRAAGGLRPSNVDVWVTADHAVAVAALADRRLTVRDARFARRRRRPYTHDAAATPKHVLAVDDATLGLEHADHERLRALAEPVLGTAAVAARAPRLAAAFAERVAAQPASFDVMADVALPGATAALADLVGFPPASHARLAELIGDAAPALDALLCPPTLHATRRLVAAVDGVKELVAAAPLADLTRGGAARADAEAVATLALVVGAHVTANLVCAATRALLDHPEHAVLVRDDPAHAAAVVEETLRLDPPVRLASRVADVDLDLAGARVRAGDQVVVVLDAANRDPRAFADPHAFRPGRAGAAAHVALDDLPARLVAPVARGLATAAVRALADRLPGLAPAGPVVRHMRTPVTGAVARQPVGVP